jgi:hypothetical protein
MTSGDAGDLLGDELTHSVAAAYDWPDYHPIVLTAIHVSRSPRTVRGNLRASAGF